MTELELAYFYSAQLGLAKPKLEFSAKETKELLSIGEKSLLKLKASGALQYSTRARKHVFSALDIYAFQHKQRDKHSFELDQRVSI